MKFIIRYNNDLTGVVAGVLMPLAGFIIFFLLTRHGMSLTDFIRRVGETGKVSEVMSVSVFANVVAFLIFNRLDMLRAARGVLGITLAWAFAVFAIKLF